ncbi:MAG: hypothetical protein R2852_03365 [Bacteroidia bacterium]
MKKYFITFLLLSSTAFIYGQCLTDHYHKQAKENNPEIEKSEQAFYSDIPQVGNTKRATKFIIPVVFHVIHTNGLEKYFQSTN